MASLRHGSTRQINQNADIVQQFNSGSFNLANLRREIVIQASNFLVHELALIALSFGLFNAICNSRVILELWR